MQSDGRRRQRIMATVPGLLSLVWLGIPVRASENFACADSEIAQAAEIARVRSAVFWSGASLPGRWSQPCPIFVESAELEGSGKTQFRLERGEVFDWRMNVAGTRATLLQDVIPHEVDHMVRVSLVRRSVERWLDEGCASVMESPRVHELLRAQAAALDSALLTPDWLTAEEYPASPGKTLEVYAVGFSLVEFLLDRGTPRQLLEFQRDGGPMPERLGRHYGLSVESLRSEWDQWRTANGAKRCRPGDCPLQPPRLLTPGTASSSEKPLLTVWTASWCGPCQRFRHDYQQRKDFRDALDAGFAVQLRDFDRERTAAAMQQIQQLPTFVFAGGRLTGYVSPEDLLQRLQLLQQKPPEPAVPPLEQSPMVSVPIPPVKEIPNRAAPSAPAATGWKMLQWIPVTLSALQWAGVIGGSVATGGIGGAALAAVWFLVKGGGAVRAYRRSRSSQAAGEGSGAAQAAPFPRQLDEAGELLGLRQSEGRVATLDTLRGMFLDDELEKLALSSDPPAAQLAQSLRQAIDQRVDEVAPLTVEVRE